MTTSAEQIRKYDGPAIFSFAFRPFFLGGALVAAVVPVLTALSLTGVVHIGGADPIAYHTHEMIYGFLPAVVAGFLFTAVPNWTGRLPVVGGRLIALFALWFAGRVAIALSGLIGAVAAGIIDSAFLIVVGAVIWREVMVGKNWRNAPVCVMITLFAAGNLLWHSGHVLGASQSLSVHWGLGVVSILLALIGGRITPSFTRNWLAKRGGASIAAKVTGIDKAAIGLIAVAMALWTAAPQSTITAWVLIAASLLHCVRLARWGGVRTFSEPLVSILHVGYFWLPVSLLLLGLSILAPSTIPPLSSLHALTAGAMGVMILAVMTRATRGHTGRTLSADAWTMLIYALVNLGAVLRVVAPFSPTSYTAAMLIAAVFWSGAFLLFAVIYGRYLATPHSPD